MKTTLSAMLFALAVSAASGADALRPAAMEPLAPGCVRPAGWLAAQLEAQASGLTGRAYEVYEDIGQSDWLTGGKRGGEFSWERGPYYAKGLVALAFALGDERLVAEAKRWADAFLASQRPDGDFGPRNGNWWANMCALAMLRDWADATGDERVVPFMERYFAFQRGAFAKRPLAADSRWAVARGGDEIESVLWLHGKTHEAWLVDFARELSAQTTDWTRYYARGGNPGDCNKANGYSVHIVNFMQGLKTPALQWRLDGDCAKRAAYSTAFDPAGWLVRSYGRPDAMMNGSEPLSDRSASGGTELCAIAERIASSQTLLSVFADAAVADDLETVAYNSLPATLWPDGRGIRYYLMLNQPACVDRPLGFVNNGAAGCGANCPGPHSGFGCCRSNFHMAWPKFVQSMWMEREGGLAAVALGECTVSNATATVEERGDYPFGTSLRFEVKSAKGGEWPLFVRIPSWCAGATASVNGAAPVAAEPGRFLRIVRDWKPGDSVALALPQKTVLTHWDRDAVAVKRGAILYAFDVKGEVSETVRYANPCESGKREIGTDGFPKREIRPVAPWGYALVQDGDGALSGEKFTPGADGAMPTLRAKAVLTDFGGWGYMRRGEDGRAIDPPPSPIPREGAPVVDIPLVPLCATQTRISIFPWTAEHE